MPTKPAPIPVACTGNIADVHDSTTGVTNALNGLRLLGQ